MTPAIGMMVRGWEKGRRSGMKDAGLVDAGDSAPVTAIECEDTVLVIGTEEICGWKVVGDAGDQLCDVDRLRW